MPTTDGLRPFAALLRQYRAEAGLSQEELAERTALSRRGISDLERGERRSHHPSTVRQLAEALNLGPTERAALQASAHAVANAPWGNVLTPAPFPVSLTSFIGREREVAEVQRLLNSTRLLTLTGAGGMGKTRLALEAARSHADVAFVDLAPLSEGRLVPAAIAAALGIREKPRVQLTDVLTAAVASRNLLLVLDNCEHLVVACSKLVSQLLHACPRLRILATSRQSLGVAGEQLWQVPAMEVGGPLESDGQRTVVATAIDPQPLDHSTVAMKRHGADLPSVPL